MIPGPDRQVVVAGSDPVVVLGGGVGGCPNRGDEGL
jgi:hypothetical protein